MNNPIIYIFLNKSLHMSSEKCSAQVAHSVALSLCNEYKQYLDSWKKSIHKTIIVLEARDDNHLINIESYLKERDFRVYKQVDEGVNEIDAHSFTALATSILEKDDENVIKAFSTFNLYRDIIKINMEFEK